MNNNMSEIQISVDIETSKIILRWIERAMIEINLLCIKSKASEFMKLKELKEQIKTKINVMEEQNGTN